MAEGDILVAQEGDLLTVTINRSAKRNAVTLAMWKELASIFSGIDARQGVQSVILTGAGGHFCAGADISEFPTARANAEMGKAYDVASDGATMAVRDCPRPTIAAVSGYAMGGGCGLALACDFRIGDASTQMGIPASRLGTVYRELDSSLLLRQVGLTNAKRVLFSGRPFKLAECRELGLVDIAADGTALDAARTFANDLSMSAPLSMAGTKLVLEALAGGTAERRAADIAAAVARAMNSEDYREATRAFAEKRRPAFKGR